MQTTSSQNIEAMFREAYKNHADAIFRHCFFRVFDREVAKELTQDTFMRTWDYLVKKSGGIDNIRAFLYKTATNLVIDNRRRAKLRHHASLEVLQEKGFEPVKKDTGANVHVETTLAVEAIQQLKGPYCEVLFLRYVHGFGPKEISDCLRLSENTVSVRIHRGLKQLQKIIL